MCVEHLYKKIKIKMTFHYVQRPSPIFIITPSHMLQQFLRKDRRSELPSLIRFLSRFNQDFWIETGRSNLPSHSNTCSQERPQPIEHINTAVSVWTFVCFCLKMDKHLSKCHPKAHGLHWICLSSFNTFLVFTFINALYFESSY